jgi:hypothetical protein
MMDLFDNRTAADILQRVDRLAASAPRQWGKMDVAQMLAHCSATLEVATGQRFPPRTFLGRILGPLFRASYVGPKPLGKNSPTDKSFIVADRRDFITEKDRLKKLISRFAEGGEEGCTRHPHAFFGKLTAQEWSHAMHKHLDHHLRQFGS